MSAGFTKGPWSAHVPTSDEFVPIVMTDDGSDPLDATDIGEEEAEANAHLIAAAPALFEACEAAEFLLAALCVDRESDTRQKLRAAIKQARGDLVDPLERVKL